MPKNSDNLTISLFRVLRKLFTWDISWFNNSNFCFHQYLKRLTILFWYYVKAKTILCNYYLRIYFSKFSQSLVFYLKKKKTVALLRSALSILFFKKEVTTNCRNFIFKNGTLNQKLVQLIFMQFQYKEKILDYFFSDHFVISQSNIAEY